MPSIAATPDPDCAAAGAQIPIIRISSVPIIAIDRERTVEHRHVWLITRPSLISQADRYRLAGRGATVVPGVSSALVSEARRSSLLAAWSGEAQTVSRLGQVTRNVWALRIPAGDRRVAR